MWLKKQLYLINPFLWLLSFKVNKIHINVYILTYANALVNNKLLNLSQIYFLN